MNIRRIGLAVILVGAILLVPAASRAGNLGIDIIGLFPKDIGEFAYADLKKARQLKWFPQLKEQMLPSRFRQFEQFLAAAGVDPNTQVDELAWALMATHKSKPGDDSHDSPGVTGEQIVPLINETNGRGVVWMVLDPAYTRLAMQQLLPEAGRFPQSVQLVSRLQALMINIEASSGVDARFQAVCNTPDEANTFAAMLQAGLMYRRYQEGQNNPELARLLDDTRITPRGDRLELRLALTDEQMKTLISRNTFAVKM